MNFLDKITLNPPVPLKKGIAYPFIEMANVGSYQREPENVDTKVYSSGSRFADGDTIIARITPCLQNGKGFYCHNIGEGFGSTEFIVLRPKDQTVDSRYLYYLMQTNYIREKMIKSMVGASGRQRVNNDVFTSIDISFPKIEIQRRIADILSAYDDLIENNRKQIKLLEEAAQRLYKEWFVDLRFPGHEHTKITDGVPEGWKRKKLVDIAQVQYGYAFDGSLFNSQKIGTPIIRIRNIPQGQTEDYTPENVDSQYLVYNGDIIVGMDGEFHINTWAGDTAYLVQRTCRIKALTSDLNGFLLWAIYEPIKYFEKTVVGATVAHLGKKHIDTVEILVPTEKFYLPFKSLFEKRLLLMNQNRALAEARDRLLPKLMSGEVEV